MKKIKVGLSPSMLMALEHLANAEGLTLKALITVLISEALTHRLVKK
jgi:hypothetical protein